ncbi:MAG TPA: hypothetical protein VK641_06560 [Terriglobales bacterium]|nr:hypothetical protein [Terriglobales bacterium]
MRLLLALVFLALNIGALSCAHAASIEKAKVLWTNGLLPEAKRELVELTFAADVAPADKAEALLLLGDIAIDENKSEVAIENWSKVAAQFPDQPAATIAKEKLALLDKLKPRGSTASSSASSNNSYPSGTVLVVGPKEFPWSIAQITGALGGLAAPFDGSLTDAMARANADPSILALVEIALSVDAAFESGRVVCVLPNGKKLWEEKVFFNFGGGQERIARRFVDGLSEKIKKRTCP